MTRRLRRYGLSVALILVCVVLLLVSLSLKGAADSANDAATKAQHALADAAGTEAKLRQEERLLCYRLNVHRVEQDDANWYREWLFDKYFLFALAHPLRSAPKPHGQRQRQLKNFERYLERIVGSMTWTPATKSCLHAGSGSAPVRFSVRQPSARDLAPSANQ